MLTLNNDDCSREDIHEFEQNKCVEEYVIALPDTIIDPGTVVVESVNASIAQITVSTPWSSDDTALWTQTICFKFVQEVQEIELRVALNIARVFQPAYQAKEHTDAEQS